MILSVSLSETDAITIESAITIMKVKQITHITGIPNSPIQRYTINHRTGNIAADPNPGFISIMQVNGPAATNEANTGYTAQYRGLR